MLLGEQTDLENSMAHKQRKEAEQQKVEEELRCELYQRDILVESKSNEIEEAHARIAKLQNELVQAAKQFDVERASLREEVRALGIEKQGVATALDEVSARLTEAELNDKTRQDKTAALKTAMEQKIHEIEAQLTQKVRHA